MASGSDALREGEGEMTGFTVPGRLGATAKGKPPHLLAAGVPFAGPHVQGLVQSVEADNQRFVGGEAGLQFDMLREKLEINHDLGTKNARVGRRRETVEEVRN